MWPVLATINGISITIFGLVLALVFMGASFAIWRLARVDYPDDQVLSLTIVLTVLCCLSFVLWRWASIAAILVPPLVGLVLWCKRFKWDIWEWLDILGPVSLGAGAIGALAWGIALWPAVLILTGGFVLVSLLKKYYRRFRWYTSGKMGFVGVASIFVWSVGWLVVAKWQPLAIYLGGPSIEQWVAIWTLIGCVVTIYLRGERKVTQDWKNITKQWQRKTPKKA